MVVFQFAFCKRLPGRVSHPMAQVSLFDPSATPQKVTRRLENITFSPGPADCRGSCEVFDLYNQIYNHIN